MFLWILTLGRSYLKCLKEQKQGKEVLQLWKVKLLLEVIEKENRCKGIQDPEEIFLRNVSVNFFSHKLPSMNSTSSNFVQS